METPTRQRDRAADRFARRLAQLPPVAGFAIAALIASTLILSLCGNLAFFNGDEWNLAIGRRGHDLDVLLGSNNGHIVLGPIVVYKALQQLFGLDSNVPYHVVSLLVQVTVSALLFAYARRRCPEWVAVLLAIVPLFLGAAWEDLLWAFQIAFFGSIAAGLGAFLMIDRRTRGGDLAAAALLLLGCASSNLGVVFAAAVGLELLLSRPLGWRRLWVPVVPAVLWGLWYLGWGTDAESSMTLDNLLAAPAFVANSLGSALAGALGLFDQFKQPPSVSATWAAPLALVFIAVVGWRLARIGRPSPRLCALLALPLGFWLLTALNAGVARTPDQSRYLYPGVVLLLLLGAELLKGVRVPPKATAVAAVVVLISIVSNVGALRGGADFMRAQSDIARAATAAVEIGRDHAPREMMVGESTGTTFLSTVVVGPYLDAVDDFGSPAYDEQRLARASEEARGVADVVLARAAALALRPGPVRSGGDVAPTPLGNAAASAEERGACLRVVPAPGVPVDVQLPPGGAGLRVAAGSAAELRLRRFADAPTVGLGSLEGGGSANLEIPADRSDRPWVLAVTAGQPFSVCGLPAG